MGVPAFFQSVPAFAIARPSASLQKRIKKKTQSGCPGFFSLAFFLLALCTGPARSGGPVCSGLTFAASNRTDSAIWRVPQHVGGSDILHNHWLRDFACVSRHKCVICGGLHPRSCRLICYQDVHAGIKRNGEDPQPPLFMKSTPPAPGCVSRGFFKRFFFC